MKQYIIKNITYYITYMTYITYYLACNCIYYLNITILYNMENIHSILIINNDINNFLKKILLHMSLPLIKLKTSYFNNFNNCNNHYFTKPIITNLNTFSLRLLFEVVRASNISRFFCFYSRGLRFLFQIHLKYLLFTKLGKFT